MVSLLDDMARCEGKPAGPSGHQLPEECQTCARRIAPRAGVLPWILPSQEIPCPVRIPVKEKKHG